MSQIKEKLGGLRRRIGLIGLVAGTSFGELSRSPEVAVYQFPPEPRVPDTVFSNVYQSEIPRYLYEAGIERLNIETGQAVLSIRGILGSALELQRDASGYCGLDLQDRIMEMYAGLGEHLDKVNNSTLATFKNDNPIVKLVSDAQSKYGAVIGRKSHLDSLTERFPKDQMAVANRYNG